VLVILRMLPRAELEALVDEALAQGLFVLLEAFDAADLGLAADLVAARAAARELLLVGVNCRDLVTLEVVPGRLEALAPRLPQGVARVAESGVASAADAARVAAAGYDLALVGRALMAGDDPRALAADMLSAARVAVAQRGSR
jgi:indole-3-glycerol phosphate synthase